MERHDDIAGFWSWFSLGPATWTAADDLDEDQLAALYDELEGRFPELTVTVSWLPGEYLEIQFSAKLRPEAASLIRAIVARAPALPQWHFVSFQPPIGFYDLDVSGLGLPFERIPTAALRVTVTTPGCLRVFVPRYDAALNASFDHAIRLLLEAGLGERWLLEELRELSLDALEHAPSDAHPLASLVQPR